MPIEIIVNADDLGYSAAINEAIFQAMSRGVITSATILANGKAAAEALRGLRHFPDCSFGVHLNLTEFHPMNPRSLESLSPILRDGGYFNGNAVREVNIGVSMLQAIYREWCAQIDSLIALGLHPSHLDSHHHVHTIPQVFPVLFALRTRYKVNKIRISRNLYEPALLPGRRLLAEKALFNSALRIAGFETTKIFTDLATFVSNYATAPPRQQRIELMTHPGSQAGEEPELLAMDWPRKLSYQTRLISYQKL